MQGDGQGPTTIILNFRGKTYPHNNSMSAAYAVGREIPEWDVKLDLCNADAVLYQLNYRPTGRWQLYMWVYDKPVNSGYLTIIIFYEGTLEMK